MAFVVITADPHLESMCLHSWLAPWEDRCQELLLELMAWIGAPASQHNVTFTFANTIREGQIQQKLSHFGGESDTCQLLSSPK